MPQGHRPDRIGDQLRMELGDLLAREVHDPGIGFITLTHVVVSPDLQHARVFYTTLGEGQKRRDTERALQRAAPFLRRQIGRRLRLRRIPELHFVFDESIEGQDRLEQLLREIHEKSAEHSEEISGDYTENTDKSSGDYTESTDRSSGDYTGSTDKSSADRTESTEHRTTSDIGRRTSDDDLHNSDNDQH